MNVVQAFFIALASVLLMALAQVLLKREDLLKNKNFIRKYLNPFVLLSYGLMFLACLLTCIAMIKLPLSYAILMIGLSTIFVSTLSYYVLGEAMNKRRVLGMTLISLGIVIFLLPDVIRI